MNLVLGAIYDLGFDDIKPFIVSLRRAGFTGPVAFFVARADEVTTAVLEKLGIQLLYLGEDDPMGDVQVNALRYFAYGSFLRSLPVEVENVMLTDVRDVVFQRDPFDFDIDGKLCCFMEDNEQTIKSCYANSTWMARAFGDEVLDELGHNLISCSGTTIGPLDAVRDYVSLIESEILSISNRTPGITQTLEGIDQAVHNYLICKGKLPDARLISNAEGPVITLAHVMPDKLRKDEQGQLLKNDGEVVNVVHQYDRHPDLKEHFLGRFG